MSRWQLVSGASRLLDPASGVDGPGEIWIRDDRIVAVTAPGASAPAELRPMDDVEVIESAGALVTPMFIDLHVHLREPGGEEHETIATGAAAALRGGYAIVYTMPNTQPTCDVPERIETVARLAREAGDVEVVSVSALSRGLRGEQLVDFEAMAAAGAGGFSDDGRWLADEGRAREALRWAGRNGVLVMQHCEDLVRTGPGVLHECSCVQRRSLPGIPRAAEDAAVERDIRLAEEEHAPLHICHVSTAGAVDAIRRAQARGLPVSGEVTPHHLVLTVEDALADGTNFKMKPPLREQEDVDALVEALGDGTLAAIATDHAPHSDARKAAGWLAAPFGAIGVETAFCVLYTQLVAAGRLPLERLVAALTSSPAGLVGREAPRLAAGAPARINWIDLGTPRTVEREALASRSHNCPFHGRTLRGWPIASLLGGTLRTHFAEADVRIRTQPPAARHRGDGRGAAEST